MIMCKKLAEQIREWEMSERDFQHAREAMMDAVKPDEARVARAALRLALKKREVRRLALIFHEVDHECAAVSVSA